MPETEPSKPKNRLRDSSAVTIAVVVLTVITMQIFAHYDAGLSTPQEIAIVAGFWFVLLAGSVWIWKHFRSRQ